VFTSEKKSSRRTSLIVDPADRRIPAYTPQARKQIDAYLEFQLALLQATETCKNQAPSCRGGTFWSAVTEERATLSDVQD
jgi:hypothetical protein